MRAVLTHEYGQADVLRLGQATPPTPSKGEVLVRVHGSSMGAGDGFLVRGEPLLIRLAYGLKRPNHEVLGLDMAGIVEKVGPGVTKWSVGDRVYGELPHGAWGELAVAPVEALARVPDNVPLTTAAMVPVSGVTALRGLRDVAALQAGQSVLIMGASGGVGTFAVQIAKILGAKVTAVCSSRNAAAVTELGADEVLTYDTIDFATLGRQWDVIFDLVGSHHHAQLLPCMPDKGTYIACFGTGSRVWGPLMRYMAIAWTNLFTSKRLTFFASAPSASHLETLAQWMSTGELAPQVDGEYTLETIPEALRLQQAGHARGKKMLRISSPASP